MKWFSNHAARKHFVQIIFKGHRFYPETFLQTWQFVVYPVDIVSNIIYQDSHFCLQMSGNWSPDEHLPISNHFSRLLWTNRLWWWHRYWADSCPRCWLYLPLIRFLICPMILSFKRPWFKFSWQESKNCWQLFACFVIGKHSRRSLIRAEDWVTPAAFHCTN